MTSFYIESETELSITYPPAPDDVAGSIPEAIWGKLESYVATRWSTAEIEYVVCPSGGCTWNPPFRPYVIQTVDGEPADLDNFGQVRLSKRSLVRCTIGGQPVTPGVEEAYRRLAAYYASEDLRGFSRYSVSIGGELTESWSRTKDKTALASSGAADLLTKYRKAGLAHV